MRTLVVGALVDELRGVVNLLVDGRDAAGERRVHVGSDLDRLDRADLVWIPASPRQSRSFNNGEDRTAGLDDSADLGVEDGHDIAERALGIVGDTDSRDIAIELGVLVRRGVLASYRCHAASVKVPPKGKEVEGCVRVLDDIMRAPTEGAKARGRTAERATAASMAAGVGR